MRNISQGLKRQRFYLKKIQVPSEKTIKIKNNTSGERYNYNAKKL